MKKVIIVGAGASGIVAAIRLADTSKQIHITLVEKNARIGTKLLKTGNGKCNISNIHVSADNYDSLFVNSVLEQYPFQTTRDFFQHLGLWIKADASGRCYPLSESANNCLNLLLSALESRNIEIKTDFEVNNIKSQKGTFLVCGPQTLQADAVLLAFGSAASVRGYNGYDLLHNLFIDFKKPTPALCPIPSNEPFLKSLKGVRVKGTVTLGENKQSGEIQFNENAVSGICAFNLAKYVKDNTTLYLDFNSEKMSSEQLLEILREKARTDVQCASLLDFLLPRKLAFVVLKACSIKPSDNPRELQKQDLEALGQALCRFPVRVQAPADMRSAQTVCGGLGSAQINPSTLAFKRFPGLFACGELLDADGPCGGYNLQWAWSSGLCAADSIKNYLEK